jgi:epoxyqueuosine reductase
MTRSADTGNAPERLAVELKRRARAEGFAAVGIARAGRLERHGERLAGWLDRGMHAEMEWMARTARMRRDPRELLPGCRSIVVLAFSYGTETPPEPRPGEGRVARYAWGRDYHRVLGGRLKRLGSWLEATTGCVTRSFVDTGPVLERGWAERAGIGWIGKNANLLHRGLGSWLLLGELLTAAELAPDPGPHAEHCGTCIACLDACPTAAIVAPGVIDSNRCISYWTIEHRGEVPPERRAGVGDWIFGCDVCQDVCPWNQRFAAPVQPEAVERRDDLPLLDAEEILGLDEGEFRARFSGTALMRAKWEGMRRNACLVIGNARAKRAQGTLIRVLGDPDPQVRAHAAWALGRIGGAVARAALERRVPVETEPSVREELTRVLRDVADDANEDRSSGRT